mmetsp:Transcript_30731/g.101733  ORF Transcript_30731/g.101733 Transcript_30731/m.101733 type:complete len:204 (-) Transcript_30731:339-950(-)
MMFIALIESIPAHGRRSPRVTRPAHSSERERALSAGRTMGIEKMREPKRSIPPRKRNLRPTHFSRALKLRETTPSMRPSGAIASPISTGSSPRPCALLLAKSGKSSPSALCTTCIRKMSVRQTAMTGCAQVARTPTVTPCALDRTHDRISAVGRGFGGAVSGATMGSSTTSCEPRALRCFRGSKRTKQRPSSWSAAAAPQVRR